MSTATKIWGIPKHWFVMMARTKASVWENLPLLRLPPVSSGSLHAAVRRYRVLSWAFHESDPLNNLLYTFFVEVAFTVCAFQRKCFRDRPKQLYHHVKMIFVLADSLLILRFEQERVGQKLINHAGKRPNIRIWEVVMADDNLWRSILSCLNIFGEVIRVHACVSKVADLEVNILLQIDIDSFPLHGTQLLLSMLLLYFILRLLIRVVWLERLIGWVWTFRWLVIGGS